MSTSKGTLCHAVTTDVNEVEVEAGTWEKKDLAGVTLMNNEGTQLSVAVGHRGNRGTNKERSMTGGLLHFTVTIGEVGGNETEK